MHMRTIALTGACVFLVTGCTTIRATSPQRSAQEELLISTAADRAAEALAAQIPANLSAFVDTSAMRTDDRNEGVESIDRQYALAAIDDALAAPDAWEGFCGFIERVCRMQADDRGFADVLTLTFPTAKGLEAESDRTAHALTDLIDRAKATGRLREDFAHQDVPLILMANAGVVNATRDAAPDAWRRLVGYLLQSFASTGAPPLPKPPTKRQMFRALMRLRDQ